MKRKPFKTRTIVKSKGMFRGRSLFGGGNKRRPRRRKRRRRRR